MNVLVTGGSGFVGSHIVRQAARRGYAVTSLSRGVQRTTHGYPVRVVRMDLVRPHGLEDVLRGVEVVIHAAGILRERGTASFERTHVGATANLLDACRRCGVAKLVYLSALGAGSNSRIPYLRTKREAERMIEDSGIRYTILRPSLIFGAGDKLVTHLLNLARYSPLIPLLADADVCVQPIWVGDVAGAALGAAASPSTDGHIYELGGPTTMTISELLDEVRKSTGRPAITFRLPDRIATPLVRIGERLFDEPPLTSQQLDILASGATCDPHPAAVTFGLRMRQLADVLPEYS